jgi:hypothetical protein
MNLSPELKKLRERREKLESDIMQLVLDFENETGANAVDMNATFQRFDISNASRIISVHVIIQL